MTALLYLIPIALVMGGVGLLAFVWTVRAGQYEDLDGAAHRILSDDDLAEENVSAGKSDRKDVQSLPHH